MWKETIICFVIIIAIIIGNFITQKYTEQSVQERISELSNLKDEMKKEIIEKEKIKSNIAEVEKSWESRHDKLAYYLEHDELEKVEAHLTSLKSFIESEEYPEAICELDNGAFVLKHIEEKYAFSVENLF